jgi:hypothetical protein
VRDGLVRATTDEGASAALTDAFLLNHALVATRVGLAPALPALERARPDRPWRAADPEGDAAARETLAAALGPLAHVERPHDAIALAASAVRDLVRDGDPVAATVAAEAGLDDAADLDTIADDVLLARLAGAYVGPGPRVGLSPAAADAVDALEWADWLGAVLQLVRGGPGADASAEQLVRNVNRCPEVTTTIPKRDAPAVASAFDCTLDAWRVTGALDADDRLSALGVWLLPRALTTTW